MLEYQVYCGFSNITIEARVLHALLYELNPTALHADVVTCVAMVSVRRGERGVAGGRGDPVTGHAGLAACGSRCQCPEQKNNNNTSVTTVNTSVTTVNTSVTTVNTSVTTLTLQLQH